MYIQRSTSSHTPNSIITNKYSGSNTSFKYVNRLYSPPKKHRK